MPGDPRGRGARQSVSADRRRPGGRARRALPGTAVHALPPGPRLFPFLLPERIGGGTRGRRDGGGTAGGGDRRELRAGPRRGQQPGQPRDRRPRLLRRPGGKRRARGRVRERIAVAGRPPGRETFPRTRGHVGRLPRRSAGRRRRERDSRPPRAAPLPKSGERRDPGAHDRPRRLPGARPRAPRHPVAEDPPRTPSGADAFPRNGLLRRAGDEGDLEGVRHPRGGGPRRVGRVRRRARVPWGGGAGPGDRPARPGGYRPPGVPAGGGGGGGSIGTASGVGGGERTLSAGAAGGWGGTASAPCVPAAGGLGKCRANISGR